MASYYSILGLEPGATNEEIKKAYKKAALRVTLTYIFIFSARVTTSVIPTGTPERSKSQKKSSKK
jgi:hypothetical protein